MYVFLGGEFVDVFGVVSMYLSDTHTNIQLLIVFQIGFEENIV